MPASLPREAPHRRTAAQTARARLRRFATVLAAATCGLLATAATVPAAFAIARPDPGGGTGRLMRLPPATVRVVAGGMAGWQIILIAVGAAAIAAAAAVRLDRALTDRPAGLAITAWRSRPDRAEHHPGARHHDAQCPDGDLAGRAADGEDTALPLAVPAPGMPDIVESGRNLM